MATEPAQRIVLYGRTSRDKSRGQSVDDQLAELRRIAEHDGRRVVAEHRDDGVSASKYSGKDRTQWKAVRALIERGDVDELALWEGSRATRKASEWLALIELCAERSVKINIRGKVLDPSDATDWDRLMHSAVDSESESRRTSDRTQRGVNSRAASGRAHGRHAFGYRTEYDLATARPVRVLDPDRAAVVREIAERLLRGDSVGSIARDLNSRGISTQNGAQWHGGNLGKMILNPAYAGIRVHNDVTQDGVLGQWPVILDRKTHDRLVTLFSDPERSHRRTGQHIRYLLPGTATCGVCKGHHIRTLTRKAANGRRTVRYGCGDNFCISRSADPTDLYVAGVVVKFLSRPDVLGELSDPDDGAREAARAEAARLARKLADLEAAVDADDIDVATYTRLAASTRQRLTWAEEAARPTHLPAAVLDVAGPDAAARWEATPVQQQREIIRALFTVEILPVPPRRRGSPSFDPATVRVERRQAGG
jgi:site-specific DNA recombinase